MKTFYKFFKAKTKQTKVKKEKEKEKKTTWEKIRCLEKFSFYFSWFVPFLAKELKKGTIFMRVAGSLNTNATNPCMRSIRKKVSRFKSNSKRFRLHKPKLFPKVDLTGNVLTAALQKFGTTPVNLLITRTYGNFIRNLTKNKIPYYAIKSLAKGLSYIPTTKCPTWKEDIKPSFERFARRLRISLLVNNHYLGDPKAQVPKLQVPNRRFNPTLHDDYAKCASVHELENIFY